MKDLLRRFVREESGQDLIEYGLLAAFAAAIVTAVIVADPLGIRASLKSALHKAKAAIDHASH